MEKKKNIAITLQEAKEWYKGDNPTLKELALKAFTKEELEKQELPKTWKEFCDRYPIKEEETFIDSISNFVNLRSYWATRTFRLYNSDKSLCTSKQEAEAFLALMQLRQLRKAYVKDWEPDWDCSHDNYCIIVCQQTLTIRPRSAVSHPLSFPIYELAEQFLDNFNDLIEIAKPLL